MDPSDVAALFYGDEASGPEKAQQLAAALRGDTQLGQLGLLTGDKVLGGVGQSLLQGAQAGQQQLQKAADMRLNRAIEAERAKRDQTFQQAQIAHMTQEERHQAVQEGLERARINQDAWHYTAGPQGTPGVMWNSKTKEREVVPGTGPGAGLSKRDEDEFIKFQNAIDTSGGRGSSPQLKQLSDRSNASKRLVASATNPDGTIKNLDPTMMTELVSNLGSVLSGGGTAAEGLIHNLTPKTLGGDVAKVQQWILGEPTGAGQQAFIKQAVDLAHREEGIIEQQIRDEQYARIADFSHLRGKDEGRFNRSLKARGIEPSSIDAEGQRIKSSPPNAAGAPAAGGLSPADQKAVEWAKKNPGNPDAQNILKLHGMAP